MAILRRGHGRQSLRLRRFGSSVATATGSGTATGPATPGPPLGSSGRSDTSVKLVAVNDPFVSARGKKAVVESRQLFGLSNSKCHDHW